MRDYQSQAPAEVIYHGSPIMREYRRDVALEGVAAGRLGSERTPEVPIGTTFSRSSTPRARARARHAANGEALTVRKRPAETATQRAQRVIKESALTHAHRAQPLPRCTVTDLPEVMCAHCTGHTLGDD